MIRIIIFSILLSAIGTFPAYPASFDEILNEGIKSIEEDYDTEKALNIFSEIVSSEEALEQTRVTACFWLAHTYYFEGKMEDAKSAYAQARKAEEKDAGIQLNEGLAYKMGGDNQQGNQILSTAIKNAGGSEKAQDLLGIASEDTSRGESALTSVLQIRTLINSLSGEGKGTDLSRGAEAGSDELGFCLYWKE